MAVLILLLVSSVIAAGIPAATNAYKSAVDGANARALLSTTVNALRGELSTSWGVEVNPPGGITGVDEIFYYSSKTGAKTRLYNDSNTIKVQDYIQYNSYTLVQKDPATNESFPWRYLVPEIMSKKTKNSTENFGLSLKDLDMTADIVSLTVEVKDGATVLVSVPLAIKLIDNEFRVPELP